MWLIYASEVSAAVGCNKYKKKWEVLLNVFKRINRGEVYKNALKRLETNGHVIVDEEVMIENIIKDNNLGEQVSKLLKNTENSIELQNNVETFESSLQENEEKIKVRKEKLLDDVKVSETNVHKLKEEVVELSTTLKTQKDKVLEVNCKLENENDDKVRKQLQTEQRKLIEEIQTVEEKTREKVELQAQLTEKVDRINNELVLHENVWADFKTAKKKLISQAQTKYGNKKEDQLIETKKIGVIVNNNVKFYSLYLGDKPVKWGVGGRIDGFRDNILVEIKNRKSRLFDPVPLYDVIQTHTYMQILNVSEATIIQCLCDEFDVVNTLETHFARVDEVWNVYILPFLSVFVHVLYEFVHDTKLQDKFFTTPDHKKSYVINSLFTKFKKQLKVKISSDNKLMQTLQMELANSERKKPTKRKRATETSTSLFEFETKSLPEDRCNLPEDRHVGLPEDRCNPPEDLKTSDVPSFF